MPTKKTTSSTSKPAAKAPASKPATSKAAKAPASAAAKPAKAATTASSAASQLAKTAAKTVAKKATKTASQAIKDLTKPAAKTTLGKRAPLAKAATAAVAGAASAKGLKTAAAAAGQSTLYQLKITLMDSDPAIWRRILVASDIHLGQLHEIIQTVMGWDSSHLHAYRPAHNHLGVFPDETYLITDLSMMGDEDETNLDETGFRLEQVLQKPKEHIVYEYDFGDSWEHEIQLEKILPADAKATPTVAACLEGEGACPPEDIGGIWGYYEVLAALADKDHPQHAEMMEYYGEMKLDQQSFGEEEITQINTELSARFAATD